MRVVDGLTVQEIVDFHHKELGVKVHNRTVKYYLSKFEIRKPKSYRKKKKYKRPPFNQNEAVWYLNKCLKLRRYPFRYLDRLCAYYRTNIVNKFFVMAAKLDPPSKLQRKILWSVFKKYEVSSRSADLFFPKRNVMIDWGKVDGVRRAKEISIYIGFASVLESTDQTTTIRSRKPDLLKRKGKKC